MALTQVNLANMVTGTLPVANGGTGSSTALIPSGTVMLFGQTAAPTGFTKLTTNDNAALRVVSGTASTGGTVNFTTAFASQAVAGTVGTSGSTTATGTVGNTTLTTTTMPSHAHSVSDPSHAHSVYDPSHNHTWPGGNDGATNSGPWTGPVGYAAGTTGYSGTGIGIYGAYTGISVSANGSSGAHNHGLTMDAHTHTGGTFTGTAINLAVKYVDIIMATKD